MKTAILSAALMLASTVAMAQKSNFQLKVDLKNFNSCLVFLARRLKLRAMQRPASIFRVLSSISSIMK